MSISGAKTTGAPTAAFAFYLFAGFWILAALLLAATLWTQPPATSGDEASTMAVNGQALTAFAVCLVGATVCIVGAVIVGLVSKQQAGSST